MANQNFRTALHGFHRDDVVQFIETKTLEHEKELRVKNDEIARLQAELEDTRRKLADAEAEIEQLHAQPADAPEAAVHAPEPAPVAEEVSPLDAPMAPIALDLPPEPDRTKINEMELAAYRRAELAERHAQERAAGVYQQIQSVFDQSNAKIINSNHDLNTLVDAIRANIAQLEAALSATCNVYQEAAAAFGAVGRITPEQ